MTDPLTDAVRRLKGLQEDIERLKAAQEQEGEPRLFFEQDERVLVSDSTRTRKQRTLEEDGIYGQVGYNTFTVDSVDTVRPAASESAVADDIVAVSGQRLRQDRIYNQATYNVIAADVTAAEEAAAADSSDLAASSINDGGSYNTIGYSTGSLDSVEIVRQTVSDSAAAADNSSFVSETVEAAVYGSATYQAATYQ